MPIISNILLKLKLDLPKDLVYHSLEHTEDVLHEAIIFASHDGLSENEILILGISAAFHDAGFLEARFGNEGIGSKMAIEAMRSSGGYSADDIKLVRRCIEDTSIRVQGDFIGQKPSTKLSKYLLDADMSNLGREDFFAKAEKVAKERQVIDMQSFWKDTLRLITSKEWFTPAAKKMRSEQWQKNIAALSEHVKG